MIYLVTEYASGGEIFGKKLLSFPVFTGHFIAAVEINLFHLSG